jgi:hypothetical protein
MANYEHIINGIHNDHTSGYVSDEHEYITIDKKTRGIKVPADFNTTIAFAGDINSQALTFECPWQYDQHSLFDCSEKKIHWYNTGSKIEGENDLIIDGYSYIQTHEFKNLGDNWSVFKVKLNDSYLVKLECKYDLDVRFVGSDGTLITAGDDPIPLNGTYEI